MFLALGILALSGILDNLLLMLGWGNVFTATEQILNDSMKSAATNTLLLALLKGAVSLLTSVEGNIVVVSANFGAFFSGFSQLLDMAFNFFLTISGLIAAKIGLLKIIELTGVSIFAGIAFILFAVDPSIKGVLGKIGKTLITIGLVLFFIFPLSIASVGIAYESHRIQTEIEYTENIGVLSERTSEISFRSLGNDEGRSNALSVIKEGTNTLWNGFMDLVISYILMFVLLPLTSLGLCYLIIRQILNNSGNTQASTILESKANALTSFMLSKNKGTITNKEDSQ